MSNRRFEPFTEKVVLVQSWSLNEVKVVKCVSELADSFCDLKMFLKITPNTNRHRAERVRYEVVSFSHFLRSQFLRLHNRLREKLS